MAKQRADGKLAESEAVIDLKSEDGCPAAWPVTFINLKSKPKGPNEVNPWEDMNKMLAVRVAYDKENARIS